MNYGAGYLWNIILMIQRHLVVANCSSRWNFYNSLAFSLKARRSEGWKLPSVDHNSPKPGKILWHKTWQTKILVQDGVGAHITNCVKHLKKYLCSALEFLMDTERHQ